MSKPSLKYIAGQELKSANKSLQQANKNLPQEKTSKPSHLKLLGQLVDETSNKEIASRLGVSETTISHWIAGIKDISAQRQLAILRESKFIIKSKMRKLLEIDDYIDFLESMTFGEVQHD